MKEPEQTAWREQVQVLERRIQELEHTLAERSWAEEKLAQTEREFRDFVQNAPVGIYRTTPEGKILLANPALVQMLGYGSLAELAARDLESGGFEPGYPRSEFKQRIDRDGAVRGLEVGWKRRDGTVIYLSENAHVVRASNGAILYYEGTVEDISRRKRSEEALLRAKDDAEAASRAKDEFLANMGHELRTPLTGIIGMAELLLTAQLGEREREQAMTIQRSADGLLTIINDVLDISRIEGGRMAIATQPFDLRQTVDDVARMLSVRASDKALRFSISIDPKLPVRLLGDAGRVRQILTNLVDNALKFTQQGEVAIELRCMDCGRDRARVWLAVSDTGIGIRPDKLGVIFDKFTQVETSAKRRYGGVGLGLAISRKLAALMGGSLGVESLPNIGSTFFLELEFPIGDSAAEKQADTAAADVQGVDAMPSTVRVLVVEDNPVNQDVVATILRKIGCQVEVAGSGKRALEKVRATDYHVIFMDCQMPGMDGFEVTARIRALAPGQAQRARIVAMTAHTLQEDRDRCLASGMDDYLAKPATMQDFREVLCRLGLLS